MTLALNLSGGKISGASASSPVALSLLGGVSPFPPKSSPSEDFVSSMRSRWPTSFATKQSASMYSIVPYPSNSKIRSFVQPQLSSHDRTWIGFSLTRLSGTSEMIRFSSTAGAADNYQFAKNFNAGWCSEPINALNEDK